MPSKDFDKCFGDERLDKRGKKLLQDLFRRGHHSVRQLAINPADLKGWYRFLANQKTTEAAIIADMAGRCSNNVQGKKVICIEDTSDINLYSHKGRIRKDKSIGRTNAPETGLGFLVHPCFVMDADNCFPYGFADVRLWSRPEQKSSMDPKRSDSLPIEQKESYKWIESSEKCKNVLKGAEEVIIIQDREGDIYEQYARIPDQKTQLIIRARADRRLSDRKSLYQKLNEQPAVGTYKIDIAGDARKKQVKRHATLEVRFCEAEILKTHGTGKEVTASVKIYAVEAREINTTGANPVQWRLNTTIPVTCFSEALQIIEWYSCRWMIEEVFRIIKEEGFNIEASELEYGEKIRKLCLLMLQTTLNLFQMRIAYAEDECVGLPADYCFNNEEQECIALQSMALEGKTEKQKNPYKKTTLRWATWVIARLGGWKGYISERPPGITTLWIGLKKFNDVKTGWELARNVSTR